MLKAISDRKNFTKIDREAAGTITGMTIHMSSPEMVEVCATAGFSFVWIDAEHAYFDLETAVNMFRAAEALGVTPLYRIPGHDTSDIARVLDAGAMGVIVPNVSTADQARAAVMAARYKTQRTEGSRGACPGTRATRHLTTDWKGFVEWSNANITVWATIESIQGVENIDQIAKVEGLDAVALGPFDLAHEMGFPGDVLHPAVTSAMEHVVARAKVHGKEVVASLFSATGPELVAERNMWRSHGVRIFSAGSDRGVVSRAVRSRALLLEERATS